jgi:hypothetical protein
LNVIWMFPSRFIFCAGNPAGSCPSPQMHVAWLWLHILVIVIFFGPVVITTGLKISHQCSSSRRFKVLILFHGVTLWSWVCFGVYIYYMRYMATWEITINELIQMLICLVWDASHVVILYMLTLQKLRTSLGSLHMSCRRVMISWACTISIC